MFHERFFFVSNFNRKTFVIISIIITLLVIENVDSIVADFLVGFNTSDAGITLYTIISIGYIIGQFFLLKLMDSISHAIKARSILIASFHRMVSIVQYVLAGNVILILIQIFVLSKYSIMSLIFVSYVVNFFTAVLFIIFALRFVSWYLNQKHNLGVLLYALSFLILTVIQVMTGFGNSYLLSQKDEFITPESTVQFNDFPEGSFFDIFYSYAYYLDYASFVLTLLASALLLYHYSKKINARKLVLILVLPILSYTGKILDALNIYNTDTNPDLFFYYIFQSLSAIVAGFLFAISFWFIARRLPESSVKNFLIITSLGFVLLYISNHAGVNPAPYPPFGINSLSLLPLSAYFVLFGLYSSALSLSQDITLRQHLRSIAKNDNNLLSSIGTAQMEREVNRAVGELKDVADEHEKELAEKTGIETPVPESEIEDYLKQVIEEVSKARKK